MKLSTLNDGSRDGQLAVVARDFRTMQLADGIALTLRLRPTTVPLFRPS